MRRGRRAGDSPEVLISSDMSVLRALGSLAILIVSFLGTIWMIDRKHDQHSPWLGIAVTYDIDAEAQAEVCATKKSNIRFTGKICEVDGGTVSVLWSSLANTTNSQSSCGSEKVVRWSRNERDPAYNARFLGSCGVPPQYFRQMPAVFDPKLLRAVPISP